MKSGSSEKQEAERVESLCLEEALGECVVLPLHLFCHPHMLSAELPSSLTPAEPSQAPEPFPESVGDSLAVPSIAMLKPFMVCLQTPAYPTPPGLCFLEKIDPYRHGLWQFVFQTVISLSIYREENPHL